jgi:hypothetical protein
VLGSSKTPVIARATQRNIPDDGILHSHRRENLKACKFIFVEEPVKIILEQSWKTLQNQITGKNGQ